MEEKNANKKEIEKWSKDVGLTREEYNSPNYGGEITTACMKKIEEDFLKRHPERREWVEAHRHI